MHGLERLLTKHDLARLGIEIIPIAITLDGESVPADLDADFFYARLSAGAEVATSQPSPAEFAAVYEAAAARGAGSVISIHLDEQVSGTAGSAGLAARSPPIPVSVLATETVSFGVGICVRAAAEALAAGLEPDAALEVARRLGSTVRNVFVAPGAESGRVSPPADWAVLAFADGGTRPLSTCADPVEGVEGVERMVEHILATGGPLRAAVGHVAAASQRGADELAAKLASSKSVSHVER